MQNEVPEKVSLVVRDSESQADFARRLFMEAARVAGMPLLEQVSFAEYMIKSGEHLFVGKKDNKLRLMYVNDISPKDKDPLVSDKEWKAKYGKRHTHVLGDFNKQELKRRQGYYSLNGGILGSMKEVSADDTIVVDLNIVYDESQYTLEQAQEAVKATIKDLQDTYGVINIKFIVTFTSGKGDSSYVNNDGAYGRIAKGAKDGKINVLLFANNKYNGKSGGLYNPASEQIFIWEGSMAEKPTAENARASLSSGAIAHEIAHLFFHYAGLSMKESKINNVLQDLGMFYALNQMRYNPLFIPDPKLTDDFDFSKDVRVDAIGGKGYEKTRHKPTYEQLIRFGAKRVASHLQTKR